GIIMHWTRKSHRNRVLCYLLAAALLNSAVRHAPGQYNPSVHCSTIGFVAKKLEGLSAAFAISEGAVATSLQLTILHHFLETTPPILRPTCML
ncbi:hypothetical protein PMAYCL1PPCAC_05949, partial [Pristionchus mayeri]